VGAIVLDSQVLLLGDVDLVLPLDGHSQFIPQFALVSVPMPLHLSKEVLLIDVLQEGLLSLDVVLLLL